MSNTVAKLLTEIERVSFAPSNQITFSTADILSIADEVIEAQMQPKIVLAREGYFIKTATFTVTANQSKYEIPDRAAGGSFRDIKMVDASGRNRELVYQDFSDIRTTETGTPQYFYLEENSVVLYPTPNATTGTLKIWFPIKANKLVELAATAVIATINASLSEITVTTIPSTWATGDTFDLIKATGGHELRGYDFVAAGITSTLITLTGDLPSDLAVGDYVALAQETSLVQLPSLFVRVLARGVAAEMIGDMNQPAAKKLLERFDMGMENALQLITPRVVGAPKYIVNENW
tara:strand:+ start:419 stop:1294 length:876 start_codon:yes stop_codon:yes gene_type:complete